MKKNIFLWVAVFAVGAMSSCSVDKVVDQAEARYIGFDPFANKVTRGLNAKTFGHSNFSVFGRYKEETSKYNVIFNNKEVKWTGSTPDDVSGSWEYESLVPWVSGKYYQFAAIAPYKASGYSYNYGADINVPGTYTLGEITVDATEANQIDYMTAAPKDNVQSGASPVSFDFNHILSKIDFKFQPKTADPNAWLSPVKIDIKKITLANVNTVNVYNADNWGTSKTPGTFEKGNDSAIYGTTTYDGADVTALEGEFSWLVVPQKNDETYSAETSSGRKLTIKFDVSTQDAAGNYTVKVLTDKEATIDITTDWNKNTHYTYTVYIGSNVLGADPYITFDVNSVQGWGGPGEETVDVTPLTTKP